MEKDWWDKNQGSEVENYMVGLVLFVDQSGPIIQESMIKQWHTSKVKWSSFSCRLYAIMQLCNSLILFQTTSIKGKIQIIPFDQRRYCCPYKPFITIKSKKSFLKHEISACIHLILHKQEASTLTLLWHACNTKTSVLRICGSLQTHFLCPSFEDRFLEALYRPSVSKLLASPERDYLLDKNKQVFTL